MLHNLWPYVFTASIITLQIYVLAYSFWRCTQDKKNLQSRRLVWRTPSRIQKRRNYKNCVIQKGFDKARNINRSQALKPKAASDQTVHNFALIWDYHLNFCSIPLLIRDHLKILFKSPYMREVFSQDKTCIRTGFHRTKDLKDMLVQSSVQPVTMPRLIIQVVLKTIARFVMLVKTFHFPIDVLLVLSLVKITKLDSTCLVGLILSFIVLFVRERNWQCVGSAIDFRRRFSNQLVQLFYPCNIPNWKSTPLTFKATPLTFNQPHWNPIRFIETPSNGPQPYWILLKTPEYLGKLIPPPPPRYRR